MKFVCKSCGFSASIPEKKDNCPFCKSDNVSNTEEEKSDVQPQKKEMLSQSNERKDRLTLTDEFFEQKPKNEEAEVYEVLKELHSQEGKKSGFPVKSFAIYFVVLSILGAAVYVSYSFLSEGQPKLEELNVAAQSEESNSGGSAIGLVKNEANGGNVEAQGDAVDKKPENSVKNSSEELVEKGNKMLTEEKAVEAIRFYNEAVAQNPDYAKAYRGLGIAYASTGDKERACDNYRKYLKFSPDTPEKAQIEDFLKSCK